MIITINGEKLAFDKEVSIMDFLNTKNITPNSVVVELNQEIIPSANYHSTWLNQDDSLEILRFVGGG
jgi:sulfur carrier protein